MTFVWGPHVRKECLDGDEIFIIRECLGAEECQIFIARSERDGYDEATINTARGAVLAKAVRDNARLMIDDSELALGLWQRMTGLLPATIGRSTAVGFNERFRFYRYDVGQKFAPHYDGHFQRDDGDRSELTVLFYLNDDFAGGETKFYTDDRTLRHTIRPERGMALVFAHLQLHEGASVTSGRKYVLRTDAMYRS
jgi:predicted 2-oxoglutarate/Fe(II)-dependent dioxygenase YbiX